MAETGLNKNQLSSGIWTEDTLIAGDNISITQVSKPEIDANTVSLYHFNDSFKDEITGNNCTFVQASYESGFSYTTGKFGNSVYMNKNGTDMQCAVILASFAPFTNVSATMDFWIYLNNANTLFGWDGNWGDPLGIRFKTDLSQIILSRYFNGTNRSGTDTTIENVEGLTLNTWHHVAYVHDASTSSIYLFFNGKLIWHVTGYSYSPQTFGTIYFGINQQNYFRLDELRISNVARWTSDFTPFTQPYSPAGGATQYQVNNTLDISSKQDALTSATGYSSSGTQVLKNIDGVLTWVTEA